MENNITDKKLENKKSSSIENLGKIGVEVSSKLGKAVTEWFTGKQLTQEEKELNEIRKDRRLQLKLMQEDAQFERDMELAKKGQYIPPEPKVKAKKKEENIFSNLGKHNPIGDFGATKSLGSKDYNYRVESGSGNSSNTPDFGLQGFAGSVNPMRPKRR
jgi:hypothetical protein